MKWERRKLTPSQRPDVKTTELPFDYLRLVEQTVTQAMLKGLEEIKKTHPVSEFYADGAIFSDEVVLTLTLSHGAQNLSATTVHASTDYEPGADPTISPGVALEKILGACVDAASAIFDYYLDPKSPIKIAQIADHSLGSLEEAPFDWTLIEKTQPPVWVKMYKTNPKLESLADDWLNKPDPEFVKQSESSVVTVEAEEFLEERLEAIKKARDGGGSSGHGGPIRH